MKQKMIVSNIRMLEIDWRSVKDMASSMGLSTNEYIVQTLTLEPMRHMLGNKTISVKPKKEKNKYWALDKLVEESKNWQWNGEMSAEDEAIYG